MTMLRLVFGGFFLFQIAALGCGGTTEPIMLEPGPACIAFCANVVGECDALVDLEGFEEVDEASCQQVCERNIADERVLLEACGDAVEAVFECASTLDCPDVESWLAQEPLDAFPCRSEVMVADAACPRI